MPVADRNESPAWWAKPIVVELLRVSDQAEIDVCEESDRGSFFTALKVISIGFVVHIADLEVHHLHLGHESFDVRLVEVRKDQKHRQYLVTQVDFPKKFCKFAEVEVEKFSSGSKWWIGEHTVLGPKLTIVFEEVLEFLFIFRSFEEMVVEHVVPDEVTSVVKTLEPTIDVKQQRAHVGFPRPYEVMQPWSADAHHFIQLQAFKHRDYERQSIVVEKVLSVQFVIVQLG